MRLPWLLILLTCSVAVCQTTQPGAPIPQGSSVPGLGEVPGMLGSGYIEFGGSRSDLTKPNPSWTDFYLRGVLNQGEHNIWNGNLERNDRFGDSGYYYTAGLTRTFNSSFYVNLNAGSSIGGFFLPRLRTDAFAYYKLLPRKQLVAFVGGGYDSLKTGNSANRLQLGGVYYFEAPFILQGGATFTHANPGSILAASYNLAITEGHNKSHFITVRAEIGREGYEIIGNSISVFNFPIHNYSGNWRQWIGNNWGLNFNFERNVNPYYNRNGATLGLFFDF